jgi:uncharacterized membrane protein HdeD (DUF308 family)
MTEGMAGTGSTTDAVATIEAFPWWLVLLEGIIALILGIVLLVWPGITLLLLVTFIGVFWLGTGILTIISVFTDRTRIGWKLLSGALSILAGLVVLFYPLYSAILLPAFLIIFIGILGLVIGFITLFQALRGAGWGAGALGILSIIIGLLILANPLVSAAPGGARSMARRRPTCSSPSFSRIPTGHAFQPRCRHASSICSNDAWPGTWPIASGTSPTPVSSWNERRVCRPAANRRRLLRRERSRIGRSASRSPPAPSSSRCRWCS